MGWRRGWGVQTHRPVLVKPVARGRMAARYEVSHYFARLHVAQVMHVPTARLPQVIGQTGLGRVHGQGAGCKGRV